MGSAYEYLRSSCCVILIVANNALFVVWLMAHGLRLQIVVFTFVRAHYGATTTTLLGS